MKTVPTSPNSDDISALLRFKRAEMPSPDYFERFIDEFHRRQSAALLHRPLHTLIWDRMAAKMGFAAHASAHPWRRLATASSLALAVIAIGFVGHGQLQQISSFQKRQAGVEGTQLPQLEGVNRLSLNPRFEGTVASAATPSGPGPTPAALRAVPPSPTSPSIQIVRPRSTEQPRYVIDARPVSFEGTLSF